MPYNGYFPATYSGNQGYYGQQFQQIPPQMMQNGYQNYQAQPGQQMPQNQPPQQAPQTSIIWVANEKEAAMFPIAPNAAVTLWNQAEPVVYLKQADASGKPTMKIYDLVERAAAPSDGPNSQNGKTTDYATKNELRDVIALMGAFKNDLQTLKDDVYGIAGKKRSSKKEAEDDG